MIRFTRAKAVLRTAATLILAAGVAYGGTSLVVGHHAGPKVITAELTSSPACPGTTFCISSAAPAAALYPGQTTPSNLAITFLNPLNVGIRIYSLTIGISIAATTTTSAPGCDLSALRVATVDATPTSPVNGSGPTVTIGYSNVAPYTSFLSVPAGSPSTSGSATYDATLSLADNGLNQDACEGRVLTLSYSAAAYYTNSTSSVLTSSTNPSTAGQQITLTDTVTSTSDSNTPAGSVSFYPCTSAVATSCSATALASAVALNGSGVATMPTTPATAGSYYYEAIYTPADTTNFSASTSNVLTQTVNAAVSSSKILLWSSENPTEVGDSVTYVAEVLGPFSFPNFGAGGTMKFSDNGVTIASCTSVHVTAGFATCTVTYSSTLNSPHTIVATYSGDANNGPGTSNTVNETISKAMPNDVVTETGAATLNNTLKFTATLSGPSVTPTGSVTWHVSTPAGVTYSCPNSTLSGGTASCSITASNAGGYSVSDSYAGDANYTSASSNTDTVSVAKATPTDVVTNTATPALGGTVKFTATVTGVSGIAPTGSVTWNVAGSAGVTSCASTTALSSDVATCTITASKAGSYVVSDTYSGDANYSSLASAADTVSVAKGTATDTLKSLLNPTTVGTAVTYTATVTGAGVTPSGSVTFKDGASAITSCGTNGVVNLNGAGVATCTVTYTSTAGSPHTITAPYSGDTNYNSATATAVTETVNKATPTNKVTNSTPTTLNSKITFTATLSGAGVTPTGTVTWNVSVPSGVSYSCPTSTLSGGMATCAITASKTGTYAVSDTYNGDANYTNPVTSATDSVNVTSGGSH